MNARKEVHLTIVVRTQPMLSAYRMCLKDEEAGEGKRYKGIKVKVGVGPRIGM